MTTFDLAAVLLVVAAVLAYVNFRTLRLPPTIAMLIAGLLGALSIAGFDRLFPAVGIGAHVDRLLRDVNFSALLMNGMLGFLLFAGSLTVNFSELRRHLASVLMLATAGVLISTAVIGAGSYAILHAAGLAVPFLYCLVFGALVSPTDPIAVLALLNEMRVPPALQINFTGESLLNDGIGVVVFTALLAVATAGQVSASTVGVIFGREVVGGILIGIVGGWLVYWAAHAIDEPNLEVLLSVALVTGLISAAGHLHVSGPLACVVAGMFIGNRARYVAMRDETTEALDRIWSFADHVMNAILFLLVGLEATIFRFVSLAHLAVLAAVVVVATIARFVSVAVPLTLLRKFYRFPRGMIRMLTWGGLRGGIPLALALSLPQFPGRQAILASTYAIVVFTIVVQGLTIERVIHRFTPPETAS